MDMITANDVMVFIYDQFNRLPENQYEEEKQTFLGLVGNYDLIHLIVAVSSFVQRTVNHLAQQELQPPLPPPPPGQALPLG